MDSSCTLCGIGLSNNRIIDSGGIFCCHGCHAVYNILSSKNALKDPHRHPIFQQAVKMGLITNPAVQLKYAELPPFQNHGKDTEKLHLEIGEMWCPSCAEVIRWIVENKKGILQCIVDYATDLAIIQYDPKQISKEEIHSTIKSMGYQPHPLQDTLNPPISSSLKLRFVIAAFCALNLMMFATPLYATYLNYEDQGLGTLFAWISCLTATPVLFYCGWPILRKSYLALSIGKLTVETLVVIGAGAAFALSIAELYRGGNKVYFDSMSVIIAFMLLGKIIELKAKFSTKNALFRIVRALPKRGRKRERTGEERFVNIKEINLGDTLVVLTGEKIPLDSIVIEGEGACDESLLTGESIPVLKKIGDKILSGSILQQGKLACLVKKPPEESALNKIISLVEQELSQKSSLERLPDKIVVWFVPTILCIAVITGLYCVLTGSTDSGLTPLQTAFYRAIAVLLISCPCAIGIAAPIAESRLIHALAEIGVIVRNRSVLRFLGKETIYLFDKTGTLTKGAFKLISGLKEMNSDDLSILKGLCTSSIHPLSKAIAEAIPDQPASLDRVEETPGFGLIAYSQNVAYLLGSRSFLEHSGCLCPPVPVTILGEPLLTYVYFGKLGASAFLLSLGDHLRDHIAQAIESLNPILTMVVSGDSPQITERVAKLCSIQNWKACCTPQNKKEIVSDLRSKGHIVAMVGDGINDAPALTTAQIGYSVINAADLSIQVSDMLLTTDRLQILAQIRLLAQKGRKIIHQNLFWAFFYNVVGLYFAVRGDLSPLFAAFAMIASSLFVVLNAKRI